MGVSFYDLETYKKLMGNTLFADRYYRNDYPDGSYEDGYKQFCSVVSSRRFDREGRLVEMYSKRHKTQRLYYPNGLVQEETVGKRTTHYRPDGSLREVKLPDTTKSYNPDGSYRERIRTPEGFELVREFDSEGRRLQECIYSSQGTIITERHYDQEGHLAQCFGPQGAVYDSVTARKMAKDYFELSRHNK